ncbi:MAG: hypothetical protein KAW12_16130 [Candidatus Aminicenantes bacterium]|nr:hypothetical protein [Candidatus Aminicenantes bacterium]
MNEENCPHRWEMVNVSYGHIITEKCFHCDKVANYFTAELKPSLDEYREGEHFWNVMETAQSFRFDLKCKTCGIVEDFSQLMGLMMCTGCDEKCEADVVRKKLEAERTYVYVAFGFLPMQEREQLTPEKITILEEYFNSRRKSGRSRIKFVSHEMVKNLATCYAEVIKDVDMLSLTPPGEK